MAGEVVARAHTHANGDVLHLTPGNCPARGALWESPVCVVTQRSEGHFNLCPFLLGVRLYRGGSIYDLDRGANWAAWLEGTDPARDSWRCICLRKEAAYTEVGARLRP